MFVEICIFLYFTFVFLGCRIYDLSTVNHRVLLVSWKEGSKNLEDIRSWIFLGITIDQQKSIKHIWIANTNLQNNYAQTNDKESKDYTLFLTLECCYLLFLQPHCHPWKETMENECLALYMIIRLLLLVSISV